MPTTVTTTADLRMYAVRMRHDHGIATFLITATDGTAAAALVCKAESAPARSVQWVAAQPVCEYCDRVATRRVRENGELVCRTCARSQTDGPLRDYVLDLAVTQWPRLTKVTHLCDEECGDLAHRRDGREVTLWEG